MKKKLMIPVLAIAVLVVCGGAYYFYSVDNVNNTDSSVRENVTVGVVLPLTGVAKSYGVQIKRTVELAEESLKSKYVSGGIEFPYSFVYVDDQCDRGIAKQVAKKMISEGVKFIIGSACSGSTLGIADNSAVSKGKVFLISPSASSRDIAELKNVFRTSINDQVNIDALAGVIASDSVSKVSIISDEGEYASSFAEGLAASLLEYTVELGTSVSYKRDGSDIDAQIAQVAGLSDIDAIVTIPQSDEDGIRVIKGIRSNSDTPIYDVFALSSGASAIEKAGGAAEGVVFMGNKDVSSLSNRLKSLKELYEIRFNEEVVFDIYLGSAFDTVLLLDNAISGAGSNPKNVIKFLRDNRHENLGVLGEYTFDKYGDVDNVLLRPVTKVVRSGEVVDY